MDNFNKYFDEDDEIVIDVKQELDVSEQVIDDDVVYEMDMYQSLINELPLIKQNNIKYQEKYLNIARELIKLKNKAKEIERKGIDVYDQMQDIIDLKYNVDWIIPVVLDKQKMYKKLTTTDDVDNEVIDKYIDSADQSGYFLEDNLNELNELSKNIDLYEREKINFKKYVKTKFDIVKPYVIKKDLNKKNIGYHFYLNQYTNLLRYFNVDNDFWKNHTAEGPINTFYEQYDEDNKFIKKYSTNLLPGDFINVIGFLVIGPQEKNIIDTLNGNPYFQNIRMIGEITKVKKNDNAIIVLPNHGLKTGDKIMITDSNAEPDIDGEYNKGVVVINENEFMIPINTSFGKEGDKGKVYSTTTLNFTKINMKDDSNYSDSYEKTNLYLFPNREFSQKEYQEYVKKIVPNISSIVKSQAEYISKQSTIDGINNAFNKFKLDFNDIRFEEYFEIIDTLEKQYESTLKIKENFNPEKFYSNIIGKRVKNSAKLDDLKNNDIFGDKYILNPNVIKYYGNYPNFHTDVDSIDTRYNWILSSPDYGKFYFLLVENERIKQFEKNTMTTKEIQDKIKEIKKEIKDNEKQNLPNSDKKCNDRKIDDIKIYKSFNDLFKDNNKFDTFVLGDKAIIENDNVHENGKIFEWDGSHWVQNPIISSYSDLCLFGDTKDLSIDNLKCLFKKYCKDKKKVRSEIKLENLHSNLNFYENMLDDNKIDFSKKIKEDLNFAEISLNIYARKNKKLTKEKDLSNIDSKEIDPISQRILKIPKLEDREYLLFLLIKRDGLLIDKNIFSISSKKKIECGHFMYLLKINEGNDEGFATKMIEELNTIYGYEEDGNIHCNNCGRSLQTVEYDENEGLSKVTGERKAQRDIMKTEHEILKEKIEELESTEKIEEILECNDPSLRKELVSYGFKPEQIADAKNICMKMNAYNGKTNIYLKKKDYISIIINVLQKLNTYVPSFPKFKQMELNKLKRNGHDISKIKPNIFLEIYQNLLIIKKISFLTARLLITYQTLIPPKTPTSRFAKTSFEGFDGDSGFTYMAQLTDELKNIPIKKTRGQKTTTTYLTVPKIKEEIEKSYKLFLELTDIKKLFKEKKIYLSRETKKEEEKDYIKIEKIEKADELPKNFINEFEKTKNINEIFKLKKQLIHREKYLIQEILEDINDTIHSNNPELYDLKKKEMFCCYEDLNTYNNYYNIVAKTVDKKIDDVIEELRKMSFYSLFFFRKGSVLKRGFEKNRTFFIDTKNAGTKKNILYKHLFLTYISQGPLIGEKHEFNEDGICLLSGESKNSILLKEYTDKEYNTLIDVLIRKNLRRLDKTDKEDTDYNIDEKELKEESQANVNILIDKFVGNITKILNKNKEFEKSFKEKIEMLGVYRKKIKNSRMAMESKEKHYPGEVIEFENKRYRERINNLKRYINQYFRKYISMIVNNFDYTNTIEKIKDIPDDISKEIQKSIYDENDFIKKYINEKNSEIFSKLKLNISLNEVDKISANPDTFTGDYKKMKKVSDFNLCHLSEALLYLLLENLNNFITYKFGDKKENIENNIIVSQFVVEIIDKIYEDQLLFDKSSGSKIMPSFKDTESSSTSEKDDDKLRDQQTKMLSDFRYQMSKTVDENDSEKVYDNLEQMEKEDALKEKFIESYKGKYEKAPTTSEITDYLETELYEEKVDSDINREEFSFSQIKQSEDDALDIGDGYGELEQGIEDDDN